MNLVFYFTPPTPYPFFFSLSLSLFLRDAEPSLNVVRATVVVTVEAVVAHVAGLADVEAFSIVAEDVLHVVIALALDALGAATTTDVRVLVVPDAVGVGAVVAVIFYQRVVIVAEVGDVLRDVLVVSGQRGATAGVTHRDGDGGGGASLLERGAGLLLGSDHDGRLGLSVASHRGRREKVAHVGVHVEGVDVVLLGSRVQHVGDFLHDSFLRRGVALLLSAELDRLQLLLHEVVGRGEACDLVLEHARLVVLLVDDAAQVVDALLEADDLRVPGAERLFDRHLDRVVHNCVEVHFFLLL